MSIDNDFYFSGESQTYRRWLDASRWKHECQHRFDAYRTDGCRIACVVTHSSDYGTITNSISVYDLLGRLVSTSVPGENGSRIVTSNTYDGATSRMLGSATIGKLLTFYSYNELGERVGVAQNGITQISETSYEIVSNEAWKVKTEIRVSGGTTNSVREVRTQLTGLSDELRARTVTIESNGSVTDVRRSFDEESEITTTTTITDNAAPRVVKTRHGLRIEECGVGGKTAFEYDALGRMARETLFDSGDETVVSWRCYEYNAIGDEVAREEVFGEDCAVSFAEYDMLGNVVSRPTTSTAT